jgi:xanthine dehydrogenase small subunit
MRFLLGDEVQEIRDIDPTMTVLDWLRLRKSLSGTKEGCAEGDCGACTVVIGRAEGERMRYEAVNACIRFMPTLDGSHLLTVEHLRRPDGRLHPVQQAMVDCHGSQCGFCTPGFVMSMFALWLNEERPGDDRIRDALAGNLCRCTGYAPIIRAARRMYELGALSDGSQPSPPPSLPHQGGGTRIEASEALPLDGGGLGGGGTGAASADPLVISASELTARLGLPEDNTLVLEQAGRRFIAPATADALAGILVENPDATIVSGATDVGLWVTKQLRVLRDVVYVGRIAELRHIKETPQSVEIGGGATFADAEPFLARHYPDFGELLRRTGGWQVRNVGTIGGNIANGSPIGDSPPALIAIGATLTLRRGDDRRSLPLEDFFIAYGRQDRRPGEFVERISVPKPAPGAEFRVYKISKRFDQDISALCGAFLVELEAGVVTRARIAFGGMAGTPKRASATEAALLGQAWTLPNVASAIEVLRGEFKPLTDWRASAEYRRTVAANLLLKFFHETSAAEPQTRLVGQGRVAHA